jgi:hypothetical protein
MGLARCLGTRPPTALSSWASSRPQPPARGLVLRPQLARSEIRQFGRAYVVPGPRS